MSEPVSIPSLKRGTPHPNGEDYLVQVLHEGRWLDYARGTEKEALACVARERAGEFRAVDWINKQTILIPPRGAR